MKQGKIQQKGKQLDLFNQQGIEKKVVHQPFLEELATKLYSQYKDGISDLIIVFPNRRAGVFFRKYLHRLIHKPIWSPEIISIESFIRKHSPLVVADKLTLIFELFQVYKKHVPHQETFDHFYFWGEMLLKDFDEADRYLAATEDLFSYLKETREIEQTFDYLTEEQKQVIISFWKHFDQQSPHQKSFLKVWKSLILIYQEFQEKLQANNIAYEGLLYRTVANLCTTDQLILEKKQVVFAGFNALNKAEEVIMAHYLKKIRQKYFGMPMTIICLIINKRPDFF